MLMLVLWWPFDCTTMSFRGQIINFRLVINLPASKATNGVSRLVHGEWRCVDAVLTVQLSVIGFSRSSKQVKTTLTTC